MAHFSLSVVFMAMQHRAVPSTTGGTIQATRPSADAYVRHALARLIQPQPTVDAVGADSTFYQLLAGDNAALRVETEAGSLAPATNVSLKFFHDALDSCLFKVIADLPGCYPTHTEAATFSLHTAGIALRVSCGTTLVDLGTDNRRKAVHLFRTLASSRYVAIDISAGPLRDTLHGLARQHPQLPMVGVGANLCAPLVLSDAVGSGCRVWFYSGSSLGDFTPEEAGAFLPRLHETLAPGDSILISIDLIKEAQQLETTYDDPLDVTAAFNLNMLHNLNRLLGTNSNARNWRHVALYRAEAYRTEMHLEAYRGVTMWWDKHARVFAAGECMHTENSVKYNLFSLQTMFVDVGFEDLHIWADVSGDLAVCHASMIRQMGRQNARQAGVIMD